MPLALNAIPTPAAFNIAPTCKLPIGAVPMPTIHAPIARPRCSLGTMFCIMLCEKISDIAIAPPTIPVARSAITNAGDCPRIKLADSPDVPPPGKKVATTGDCPNSTSAAPKTSRLSSSNAPLRPTSPNSESSKIATTAPPLRKPLSQPRPSAPTFSTSRARLGNVAPLEKPSVSVAATMTTSVSSGLLRRSSPTNSRRFSIIGWRERAAA